MKIEKICKECGISFIRKPSKAGSFCSRKCWGSRVLVNCKQCNKEISKTRFRVRESKNVFCSRKCKSVYYGNLRITKKVKRKCKFCGIDFFVKYSKIKAGNLLGKRVGIFCSRHCKSKWIGGLQTAKVKWVMRLCKLCKKLFKVKENQLAWFKERGTFCSRRCSSLSARIGQSLKPTDIERMMEAWLIEKNIPYSAQVPIERICIADFFIAPDIVIFCDGDYWHSLPETVERDKRITDELVSKGFKVYRLLGSKIEDGIRPEIGIA